MKMLSLNFEFDELPLITKGCAGLLSGQAEISFDEDGDWGISTISLDGFEPPRGQVAVERGSPLFTLIYAQLEELCSENIEQKVFDYLDEEGLSPMRRYSTLNRQQQGISR